MSTLMTAVYKLLLAYKNRGGATVQRQSTEDVDVEKVGGEDTDTDGWTKDNKHK